MIAFDTETNGKYAHKGHRLCGVSAYTQLNEKYTLGIYFPFRHSIGETLFNVSINLPLEWLSELGEVLAREDLTTIWHGFKFDAMMLRADGIEVLGQVYDTLTMSFMVDENSDHSLDGLERQHFGTSSKAETKARFKQYLRGTKDFSKVPPADMEPYAVNDARLTYDIWHILVDELAAQDMLELWPDSSTFLRCLFELESQGIPVDQELASRLSAEAEGQMRELEDEMEFDPGKKAELARRLFASPPLGLGLHPPERVTKSTSPEFPNGLPGMDEEELLGLQEPCGNEVANRLVDNVLQYRGLVKANSTWYAGFLQHSDATGRIHPVYNTGGDIDKYGARTSRLTCSGPNIQQLPRDPERFVYKLLVPPPRHRLYVVDYNQIEYRLGAVYAEEEDILEAYRQGGDMHQVTADKLGIPRVDPHGKVDGKKFNFTAFYGASGETIAKLMGIDKADGEALHKEFWSKLPKLRQLTFTCTRAAKAKGYVRLWNGRRRHFANEWEMHKAFNSLIQGGAAQIVERSMIMLHRRNAPFRMCMQIHDAIGFMVPDDFREDWLEEIRTIMEWPGEGFGLPFPVEFKNVHKDKEAHTCEECAA